MVDSFIGREEELKEISEVFHSGPEKRKIVVLHGLGGIGKTQLAAFYARQHSGDYRVVVWLNGKDEDALNQSFVLAAQRLQNEHARSAALTRIGELPNASAIAQAMVQWLSLGKNKRWLLVFDNVDNPKLPSNPDGVYDLEHYIPVADHGHVMITTRRSGLEFGKCIHIKRLIDIQESLALIASTSGRNDVYGDPDAEVLARRLGGLPLALSSAGALLRQTSMSFAYYLQSYEQSWHKLQDMSGPDKTLRTTWGLSFEKLQIIDRTAAELLRLWGHFDNQDLWYKLIATGQRATKERSPILIESELDFHKAMQSLCEYGLAEPTRESDGYSCHPCVHDWSRNVLGEDTSNDADIFSLLSVGLSVPQQSVESFWILQQRLLSHANRVTLFCLEKELGYENKILDAIHYLGDLYASQGKIGEAEKMYQRALIGYEKAWGPDHSSTLDAINSLGNIYAKQGKIDEAEKMYQRALIGKEKIWGPDHSSTLDTINNLGLLYADQGKIDEAEKMYQRVLIGDEKICGPDHILILDTFNNLGNLYFDQCKMGEAEKMYQRALIGYEKIWNVDHPSTLDTINNLGNLYAKQSKIDEAEKMYRRALIGNENTWGPDHPSTLDTIGNLGNLYAKQGKIDEAEKMYQRALIGDEKIWGPDHPSTLGTINNLGLLYAEQSKIDEAEKMYQRALIGKENTWGPDHPSTLDTINNLGNLYAKQGKIDEAEKMYQRALIGYEKARGPDHPSTLDTIYNLGLLYAEQSKIDEAEKMYQRALIGYEKTWGPDHPSTLRPVNHLGMLYKAQGKTEQAEKMFKRALQGYEMLHGSNHPNTQVIKRNLSTLQAEHNSRMRRWIKKLTL